MVEGGNDGWNLLEDWTSAALNLVEDSGVVEFDLIEAGIDTALEVTNATVVLEELVEAIGYGRIPPRSQR